MEVEKIRQALDEKIPGAVLGTASVRGEDTIEVKPEQILPVCRALRDEFHFNFLTDLCGMDHAPREPRFGVVYHLCDMQSCARLRLKISVPETDGGPASVVAIWKAANWLEREVFDMYGIRFSGHPDLRRILTPPDWEGYPLRKDYPLRGNDQC